MTANLPQTGELNMPQRLLLGPGPSEVPPRVLRAMASPLVGHLDPAFLALMDESKRMMQAVFKTSNELTISIPGTGSAGMEACVLNLLEPGDEILIGVNGVFGGRMCDVAERAGAKVHRVEAEWGKVFEPAQYAEALGKCSPKVVAIVHAETSTGARQPLEEIGKLARAANALFLVDAVTSLGGIDVRVDEWGIDAIYSGTQKCLSCPPGLSPVSFSPRAGEAIARRKTKCRSWYLDASMLNAYWGAERVYHHTAPITMLYALHEALRLALEEGLEARFARHRANHELLARRLGELGIEFVVDSENRLPQLNAVRIPDGADDAAVRGRLLRDYGIEIGGGLGAFKGKVWRIGLMGASSTPNSVNALAGALEQIIKR